jgi:thiamine transport system substrate-binding protein
MEKDMKKHLLAAGLLTIATPALAETPVLTVLTYDSFTSEWGPGPAIEKAFEATCACDLRFVPAGDGAALLARIQLEGAASDADVVLGLDTSLTAPPRHGALCAAWENTGGDPAGRHATRCSCPSTGAGSPLSMTRPRSEAAEKLRGPRRLRPEDRDPGPPVLDPRSWASSLGQGGLWRQGRRHLGGLADNIVTVTPGWSEAYGLFLEGEADMVLSYTTSPAYHLIAESDDTKAAALFDEGHYLQIEVAGKLAATDQPDLADSSWSSC